MSASRRTFLSWLGSASALGVATPARAGAARWSADLTAEAHAPAVGETWDMSWTSRLNGKYKAVFDSPELSGGAAIYRAVAWIEQYKEVYNAEPAELSAVVVLRHLGFYLGMNDEYWSTFDVGKELKLRDDRGRKWAKVNPVGGAAGADEKARKYTIPGFQALGGVVLGCGWSFGGAASRIAKRESLATDAARARARELLLPGVILQPNGIFAALRAQEAGCSYVDAS